MKNTLIVLGMSIALVGCFGAKKLTETPPPPSPPTLNIEKAQVKFEGYTLENYNSGKMLYNANCHSCHGLKDPLAFTEEQWSKLVPGMSAKSNAKKGTSISKEDEELIFRYVVSQSLLK